METASTTKYYPSVQAERTKRGLRKFFNVNDFNNRSKQPKDSWMRFRLAVTGCIAKATNQRESNVAIGKFYPESVSATYYSVLSPSFPAHRRRASTPD